MKIKTISRSADDYVPVRNTQDNPVARNLNPELHPFQRGREYTRALNATKLERVFAQPFVGQLGDGHRDGVYAMAKNMKEVGRIATGSGDGVVKYWDLSSRKEMYSFKAHHGMVTGLVVTPDKKMMSCGSDKTIKLWDVANETNYGQDFEVNDKVSEKGLVRSFQSEFALQSMDHHRDENLFVTGGAEINLWDTARTRPVANLSWGADNITAVKFNMTETSVIASAGADNSIVLYDTRTNSATQKIRTRMRTNAICWNPMEAYVFASACEDHNGYLWDMRRMERALNIYEDHMAAVMDIDFSPTGQEVVTGSYDKTIRIFGYRKGHSRDVYHTKRMQRVFVTKFSMDSRYIFSGSDDGNVRVWRTKANERSAPKSTRERIKLEYDEKLKQRYASMPEIRRIARHRHLPKVIRTAQNIERIQNDSERRKDENVRRHTKGVQKYKSARERPVVGTAHKE